MIEADIAPPPRRFAARLAARAASIAVAHAESRLRAVRQDPARWRIPRLLWPHLAKGE